MRNADDISTKREIIFIEMWHWCFSGTHFLFLDAISPCRFIIILRHSPTSWGFRENSSSLWVAGPGFLVSGVVRGSHSPYGNPGVPIPRRGATSQNTDVSDWFVRVIAIKDQQIGSISYSGPGAPSYGTGRMDLDLAFTCWFFCFRWVHMLILPNLCDNGLSGPSSDSVWQGGWQVETRAGTARSWVPRQGQCCSWGSLGLGYHWLLCYQVQLFSGIAHWCNLLPGSGIPGPWL